MDELYYDVYTLIFNYLDTKSLTNLLNCNNKNIYNNLIKYIKQTNKYKDIIRYDIYRFEKYYSKFYMKRRPDTLNIIKKGCSLIVFQCVFSWHGIFANDVSWFSSTAESGNLENMKWLEKMGCHIDKYTFDAAIETGILENIQWLHSIDCPYDNCLNLAIRKGNLEIIKYLKGIGLLFDKFTFYDAVIPVLNRTKDFIPNNIFLENLKKLYSKPNYVASRIEIMEWLKLNGCDWGVLTYDILSQYEMPFSQIYKWMYENDCPQY
ncbi:ankyrin repeat protein [Indivirus ILV1]|uniref:Ankyrin repeat protein n=1 Tax=Indivirus ILV1 TaxID=1977633 RepID=A0A1V0SD39_9VIRU|nr:ankyrin repeat protein [Indivirus ILV1]